MKEEKFILNASRLNLSDKNITRLKDLSNKNIDWDLLSKKASFHGVTPFIYYSLKKHNLTALVPANILNKFKEDYYVTVSRNVKFIKKIHELSDIIKDRIILLKGAYLINSFYPDIGVRSMSDIDILVEKDSAAHVWDLLKTNGYIPEIQFGKLTTKSAVHENFSQPHHLDILFSENCGVEIHTNLFESHDFFNITEIALEKARLIDSKSTLYRLSDETFLIHLCSHFYAHNFLKDQTGSVLRMLCDINEFILKRGDDIDWDELEKICNGPELKNRISTTLTYTNYFLQTPIPANFKINNLIEKDSISIESLSSKELLNIQKQKSNLGRFFFRLKGFDKHIDRLIFVFRTLIPVREWIKAKYNTKNYRELIKSYLKYWKDLFIRYILKKM